jgi:hypothetical protein
MCLQRHSFIALLLSNLPIMRIKVLMIGDDPVALIADIQLLRDTQFLVYTSFDTDNLVPLIEEIHPDIIFINPQHSNSTLTDVYNTIVGDIDIPVIYTLSEDELYFVTRKNGALKRKVIGDSILAAVKLALQYDNQSRVRINFKNQMPPEAQVLYTRYNY